MCEAFKYIQPFYFHFSPKRHLQSQFLCHIVFSPSKLCTSQLTRLTCVRVVVDYSDTVSAKSLTTQTPCPHSCWLCWHSVSIVVDHADTGLGIRTSVFWAIPSFLWAKEQKSYSLVKKGKSLPLLFCHEQPERIAHNCSFVRERIAQVAL